MGIRKMAVQIPAQTPNLIVSENQNQKDLLIDFLRELNISFEIDNHEIRIYGHVKYINLYIVQEIIIFQNDKKIVYDEFLDYNRILIESENEIKQILLDKSIRAYYEYPNLIIQF